MNDDEASERLYRSIPQDRLDDVIYIDPEEDAVSGFNALDPDHIEQFVDDLRRVFSDDLPEEYEGVAALLTDYLAAMGTEADR